jgi:hypothetical protein
VPTRSALAPLQDDPHSDRQRQQHGEADQSTEDSHNMSAYLLASE